MRNTHEIHNYFHTNTLKTHLICNICFEASYNIDVQLVQVENFNKDDYTTEEEIEEVIETNQVLLLVQSNKRKRNEERVVKEQKISSISLNTKKSIFDLNIQDKISLRIEGKCTLNFN
ncbi:hypothetical protein F8M41_023590 [Gigaspora margarita]|uniref:Uncharacterized protein n=1 Tax=Gigaspora margarita TaxID=4874 RepID=A0A8H4EH05_GIGMA|nr:hypothetical protein F8M41_023590 [Gigaspora margarita]